MWMMEKNAILTKDNMLKRNRNGDSCYFYDQNETMLHLLLNCSVYIERFGLHLP
jgi:hypothetical protein